MEDLLAEFLRESPIIMSFIVGICFALVFINTRSEGVKIGMRCIRIMDQRVNLLCRKNNLTNGECERVSACMTKDILLSMIIDSEVCSCENTLRNIHQSSVEIDDDVIMAELTNILVYMRRYLYNKTTPFVKRRILHMVKGDRGLYDSTT